MVICQVSSKAEQDAVRSAAEHNKTRVAYEADNGDWRIMQLHPGDMRGAYLEADWDARSDVTGNWMPAGGMDWQGTPPALASQITAAELQSPEPIAMAEHWGRICSTDPKTDGDTATLTLDNAVLRFVPEADNRGPGLSGIDLASPDPDLIRANARERGCVNAKGEIEICGTRITLT